MRDRDQLLTFYRDRVDGYGDAAYRAVWRQWCRRLLTVGGELVVPPLQPEGLVHLERMLAVADEHTGAVRRRRGEPCNCHGNASALWATGKAVAIGTGYALSDDGLWRQHSWGLTGGGTVLETTVGRLGYVGLQLTGVEALHFALANNAGAVQDALAAGDEPARRLCALLASVRSDRAAG